MLGSPPSRDIASSPAELVTGVSNAPKAGSSPRLRRTHLDNGRRLTRKLLRAVVARLLGRKP